MASKRRKTAAERSLTEEVGSLKNQTEKMEGRLEAASQQNQKTITTLSKVVDIAFDDKKVIADLSRDLNDTKTRLNAIERRLVGLLDAEQKEIANKCQVSNVEFACEYVSWLHSHRDMINEIQTMRAT